MPNSSQVLLREATDCSDATLVLSWRSNPLIWQGSYVQNRENRPLTWEEHWKWWKSQKNGKIFIVQLNDGVIVRDVGYLNIGGLDKQPDFSIAIGEVTLWGKGIAKQALLLGIEWLKKHGYREVYANIIKNNERSIRLFKSVGFKTVGDGRDGEWKFNRIIA